MEEKRDLRRRRRREWLAIGALALLAVGAVAALHVHNRRAAAEAGRGAFIPKKTPLSAEARLLQEYVRIDTSNPPGNELRGAQWLAGQLQKAGIASEIIESAPGRATLYARIRGRLRGEGLLLLNHIDVVPADPKQWSVPPFSGQVRLNMLHGRGSIDMKGIAICQLAAFVDAARRGTPERDIVFLAVADEEQGGGLGTQWLLARRRDVFDGIRYVLTEGGTTEMRVEEIHYFGIETGSKQLTVVDLAAPSREQLRRARIALEPHFFPRDPDRVLPEVRRYFRAIAPGRVENRDLYEDVDAAVANGKFWLLPVAYRELLQNTIVADGTRPGDGGFRMTVRLVNLPDEDPDARIEWLRGFVRPHGVSIAAVMQKEGPAPLTSEQTPLFELIVREVRRQHPAVPVGPKILSRSTNDCRFLRKYGMSCYGLQPFPLDFYQSLSIHGVDERVRLDWFDQGVDLCRTIVSAYAFRS